MTSATTTIKMKGGMLRTEPKTIYTVDVETSAWLPMTVLLEWQTQHFI